MRQVEVLGRPGVRERADHRVESLVLEDDGPPRPPRALYTARKNDRLARARDRLRPDDSRPRLVDPEVKDAGRRSLHRLVPAGCT